MFKRSLSVGLVVSGLAAVWAVQPAHAIVIVNSLPVEFGPQSLAQGQAIRFYVANPAIDAAAPVCQASVVVYDRLGNTVAQSQPSALPGEIGFFDVSFDVFVRTADTSRINVEPAVINVPFRAVVRLVPPGTTSETVPGPPDCVLTAEVFDLLTGRAVKVNEAQERDGGHGGGNGARR